MNMSAVATNTHITTSITITSITTSTIITV